MHYGQRADAHLENLQLKSQLLRKPLSGKKNPDVKYSGQFRQDSLRFVSKESKTICKQRSKTKSSVTSLRKKSSARKKSPSENIAKRACHSSCQNAKFNSEYGINRPFASPSDAMINDARIVNRHGSSIASVKKHPRSYAQMIADYSESLYEESAAVAARDDSFRFSNAFQIRKSPFSTLSGSPSAMKIVAEYDELANFERNDLPVKSFDLCNRYGNVNAAECYDFQYRGTAKAKNINQSRVIASELRNDDQSYAKLIADCSKSMHTVTSVSNDGPVPKENARSSLKSIAIPRKDGKACTRKELRGKTPVASTMSFEEIKKRMIELKEYDLLREMEAVMNDMKRASERKIAKVAPKMKEIPRPVDEPDNSSGELINGFTKSRSEKQMENDTVIKKSSYQSKIDRMERSKQDFKLQKHNYAHPSDRASNLPRHFGNAAESSAVGKTSTGVAKEPQIKLRMVPSEKESVVSINVDQPSLGSLDPLNSKHLSVVVQSDRKEELQINKQWNAPALRSTAKSAWQHGDFGPMRISISEDSAPVKQIEFSINGKPVSELKSITARAERLDVVSSADKIEIRVPYAGDDASASDKTREGDHLSKGTTSSTGQILNVQISANFQDESTIGSSAEAKAVRYDKGRIPLSTSAVSKPPYVSNNFLKSLNSNNVHYESSKQADVKFNDEKNVNKISDFETQRKATKNSLTGKIRADTLSTKEVNNVEVGRLREANIGFPGANRHNKNESPDDPRVPSKIIPWWASSDSFNKIRKKDDYRSFVPPLNRNDHKAVSNLNKNFGTVSKPKEISNSKIVTKKARGNNATVTGGDSSNTIFYSNSMKPYEKSESIPHYAYSFKLKPNQGNLGFFFPEIMNNNLKTEDNQTLTANKDKNVNKISVKQAKPRTLLELDTMNIKGKHDMSIKEKTFVLQRKSEALNSAQNLSPTRNEKKENNFSLKQTKSIDDVSKNIKSEMKDSLDAVKSIEKRGGIFADYGLKREMPSRKKPTVILKSGVKEIQNPSPVIRTKDPISNSSTAVSNKIDKPLLTKQMETKEKLKTKTDGLLKEKDLRKKDTTVKIKALNKNDVKNIKEVSKNDFMSSNSSDFRNSPELTQTLKNQEQLNNSIGFRDKSKQNLKSLSEVGKIGPDPLLNTRVSVGMVQGFKQLGVSGKVSLEEPKQSKPKNLTSVKNAPETIQEVEKLKGSPSSKLANPRKEPSDAITTNKSPLRTVKQMQSKNTNKTVNINIISSSQRVSNLALKIKDRAGSRNLINKKISEISVTQSVKKTDTGDVTTKIITQNPKNLLSKDYEKNFKPSSKRSLSGLAGSLRKPSDSVSSAGSKSRVMANNSTYDRKLPMESFCSNSNGKNDIMSNSQSAVIKAQQNLSDNVNMLGHPVPTAFGCDGSINMDRPEKIILYSAWLQRSDNDVKKNRKLF